MTFVGMDWLQMLVRWAHVICGIAWIGASFYYVWQDDSLEAAAAEDPDRERLQGQLWAVHGGGFYHVRKFKVAPARLPEHLHWFKWESYMTWVSGFGLLILLYWMGASTYMLPADSPLLPWQGVAIGAGTLLGCWVVYDLLCRSPLGRHEAALAVVVLLMMTLVAWGLSQVFTGRAMFLHVGAALGTIMSANVFFTIIPNQRVMVAAMLKGEAPDGMRGKKAKQRSVHNTYFTLPVLFLMISNHYPMVFASKWNWVLLVVLCLLAALVRRIFVINHFGRAKVWMLPAAFAALVAVIVAATPSLFAHAPSPKTEGAAGGEAERVAFPVVAAIVQTRCHACHSSHPTMEGFDSPPQGLTLDSPAEIAKAAPLIDQQAVKTNAMPLGNITGITPEERALLGRWIAEGARQ